MSLHAINDKVIVEPDLPPEQTESGIALAHGKKFVPETGTVVSAGFDAFPLEEGNRIVFDPKKAVPIFHDGKKYLRVKSEDVHCTVEA